ncbi:MAG: MarC family protein [Holophagaceae bacterium]
MNATRIFKKLGTLGEKILTKLMGLILAGVGMQFLINGILSLTTQIRSITPP